MYVIVWLGKFPELVDTYFIVLRKKPLIFLHWYHHVTVLLYCWLALSTQNSSALYFISMNYFVHSVMYCYYALQVFHLWPKYIPSWIITILQMLQMVLGVTISMTVYIFKHVQNRTCNVTNGSLYTGMIMYASYFFLFLHVYIKIRNTTTKKKDD